MMIWVALACIWVMMAYCVRFSETGKGIRRWLPLLWGTGCAFALPGWWPLLLAGLGYVAILVIDFLVWRANVES